MAQPKPQVSTPASPIVLAGVIDDRFNLAQAIPAGTAQAEIRCRDVRRINSVGVANWYLHFEKLRKSGAQLRFVEVAPALVRQMNYVKGFILDRELKSFCIPYLCLKCGREFITVREMEGFTNMETIPMERPCERCGAKADLDDIPTEYFSFMTQATAEKKAKQ